MLREIAVSFVGPGTLILSVGRGNASVLYFRYPSYVDAVEA